MRNLEALKGRRHEESGRSPRHPLRHPPHRLPHRLRPQHLRVGPVLEHVAHEPRGVGDQEQGKTGRPCAVWAWICPDRMT